MFYLHSGIKLNNTDLIGIWMILEFQKMVILLMYNIYLFRNKERTQVHAFDWSREHWSLVSVGCCNLSWVISHISSAIVSRYPLALISLNE